MLRSGIGFIYFQVKCQVVFEVGVIISSGGAIFEYEYKKSLFIYNVGR